MTDSFSRRLLSRKFLGGIAGFIAAIICAIWKVPVETTISILTPLIAMIAGLAWEDGKKAEARAQITLEEFDEPEERPKTGTLGERHHNPLNIKSGGSQWKGMVKTDNRDHAIFESIPWGLRAAIKQLFTYKRRHGLTSIAEIIGRWAPSSDTQGSLPGRPQNDPRDYARFVSNEMGGFPPNEGLGLFGPSGEILNPYRLSQLLSAMAKYENHPGYVISDSDLNEGFNLYLNA